MKRMKRIGCAALTAALCAGLLAGCGGNTAGQNAQGGGTATGTGGPTAEAEAEFVYQAEYVPVEGDSTRNGISIMDYANGKFYASVNEKTGEVTEEMVDDATGEVTAVTYPNYSQRLCTIDLDGKTAILPYQMESAPVEEDGKTSYQYLNTMSVGKDGTLYLLEEHDTRWSDAPEGVTEDSEEYWDYVHYTQSYILKVLSPEGEPVSETSLDSLAGDREGEDSYFYINGMAVDGKGNVILSSEQKIFILDAAGALKTTVELDDWMVRCLRVGDDVYCGFYGENGQVLSRLDVEAGKLDEPIPVKGDLYTMSAGGGDYDLYYNNGINFYGCKLSTGENEKLLNWISCDVNPDNGSGRTVVMEDGRVVTSLTEWEGLDYGRDGEPTQEPVSHTQLIVLTKVPASSVPQKEVLTLGTQYLNYQVRDTIIKFNRSSEKYRIEVKDYSEYNTEDDYSAGLTKLQTEVLSGVIPDILDLNGLPMERFAAKGYLEDLYPWMDQDAELSRETLLPTVAKAMETDGKLYMTADSFAIQTVAGGSRIVGDKPGWTLKDYKSALALMPEGCQPFDRYTTREVMLDTMLSLEAGSFVNRATGECSFDSPAFVELLEFVNGFPAAMPDMEGYEWSEDDEPPARISRGEQMLYSYFLYSADSLAEVEAIFGGNMTFIGYPVSEGTGSMFQFNDGNYAMSSRCANKEAAWEFLRQFFTERYQDENIWRLPTNAACFEKKLSDAMKPQYQRNGDGSFVLDENGNKKEIDYGSYNWGGVEVKFHPLTQAEADQIRELVATTTRTASYDQDIHDIVAEGAAPFFDGKRSAEDVAKQIQSKAMLYVNEQR